MADSQPELRALFCEALDRQTSQERAEYLDQACRGKPELRARVEALLRAHEQASGFLKEESGNPAATVDEPLTERPGTVIGPYKLSQQIGEGGMGTVFMAEQQHPVQRKVALKIIKPGMDSRQVIARFEAERQALALMDHPNIAKVLDAGETASGRPYFVMELVKGLPITKYCDEHHLTPRQRLELFVPVCQAVQHAHQKGIIHRDLKPSNVMVCLYDGKPVPKVIDFGVAKAAGPRLTEHTLFTEFGQVVGTFEYMSPEQAELNQLDIDTRSDIYSLGVLLYELLTGTTPLERKRFKEVAFLEVLRLIREEESPKPSTRLSTTEGLPSIAANRGSEPRKLGGLMRGELDWIAMKALDKDRNRRYETANGFALDILRYLADEAVQACPPSPWYRFRKFARRNRVGLATAGVMTLMLLVALGGISIAVGWAVRDRAAVAEQVAHENAARQAMLEGRISQALDEAEAQYEADKLPESISAVKRAEALLASDNGVCDEIRQRVDQWRAELTILQRLEELAVHNSREQSRQTDAAYSQVFLDIGISIDEMPVEETGRRIRSRLAWKRLTEALDRWTGIRQEIAVLDDFKGDCQFRKARLLQIARAADSDALRSKARFAVEKWDLKAAEHLAASPEVSRLPASTLRQLAMVIYWGGGQARRESAARLLVNAQIQRPGDFGLNVACASYYTMMDPPRWDDAAHYWSIALAIRPEDTHLQSELGRSYANQSKFDEAFAHYSKAIELDPKLALAWYNRGVVYANLGQPDKVIADSSKAIKLDPKLAQALRNRGSAYARQGQKDKAIADVSKAMELTPDKVIAWRNQAYDHRTLGQFDEAVIAYSKALELNKSDWGTFDDRGVTYLQLNQPEKALSDFMKSLALYEGAPWVWHHRALSYCALDRWQEALADFEKVLDLAPNNAAARNGLAMVLAMCPDTKLRDPGRAIELARKAVQLAPEDEMSWQTLGWALCGNSAWKESIESFRKSIELQKNPKGGDSGQWFGLAVAHWQLGNKEEARKWFDQAVEWMEMNAPKDEMFRRFRAEAEKLFMSSSPRP